MVVFVDDVQPQLHALCFLLDLGDIVDEVALAWTQFAAKKIGLLAATAVTNACVAEVQRMASTLHLECQERCPDSDLRDMFGICEVAVGLDIMEAGGGQDTLNDVSCITGPLSMLPGLMMGAQLRSTPSRTVCGKGKPWLWPNIG
jgi:hypothetical protein